MDKKKQITTQTLGEFESFLIRPLKDKIDFRSINEGPHIHHFQEIIYVSRGKGLHHIDGQEYIFRDKTFYLIGQSQVHSLVQAKNLSGYLIRFKSAFLPPLGLNTQNSLNSTLLGSIIKTNELHVDGPEIKFYESILDNLYYEFEQNSQTYAKIEILQYFLLVLLTKLERRVRQLSQDTIYSSKNINLKIYQAYLLLIEDNYRIEHRISAYVSKLNTNKRKLASICQHYQSKTPKQILNERLMLEARRLLLFTSKSSKEIAYSLGYNDPAYFSRFFKKYYGISANKYKNKHIASNKSEIIYD